MYTFHTMGADHGKIDGSCEDMETALEKLWTYPNWIINRVARRYSVAWIFTDGKLRRSYADIVLNINGTATDSEIDYVMHSHQNFSPEDTEGYGEEPE